MPSDAPDFSNLAETVSCRPSSEWWAVIAMAVFFTVIAGLALILPSNPPPLHPVLQAIFFGMVSVASLLAAAWLTWWTLNARILADTRGLRWRGLFGWKSARWEEVQDYYDRLPSQSHGQRHSRAIIKTSNGTISFSSQWTHVEPFREQVERRVTQARAQEWGVWGSRPCDPWPQVFDYGTWSNRWMAPILSVMLVAFLAYTLAKPVLRTVSQFGVPGWGVTLAMLGVFVVFILSKGALLLLIIGRYREAGHRRSERITVDTRGILFDDGARRVEAAWTEVTGYGIVSGPGALLSRNVVETRQGELDFLASIKQATLLQAIIQRYAVDAADKEWRLRVDPEALGGEAARWSGGRVGVGARVYHYQPRMYRALLWLPFGLCMALGFEAWTAWQGVLPGTQAVGLGGAAAACGLIFLGGWYAYRVCRVETDEGGLTWITPLARRRLVWGQVEDYWLTGEHNSGVVQGRSERLRFSRGIVGYEELKEEIARRAVACGSKAWERRATTPGPDGRRRGRRGPGSSARG